MSNEFQKDDALFEQLGKNKKRRRKKVIITVVTILLLVAVALVITVGVLRKRVRERFASGINEPKTHMVARGTLSTVVSGNGILEEDTLEALTVPEGVEIMEILVDAFDTVTEGQLLATVDMSSVLSAMATLQESMATLDKQINSASNDKVSTTVSTAVAGRVKIIYGEKDMRVADCMSEHGALAVLSLDGYMALDLQTDVLQRGDTVTVVRAGGKELTGTVERVVLGKATILVTDDGTEVDEVVTVTLDGQTLGEGTLYIHEPLSITGYAGTIQTVSTALNRKVYKGSTLFQLKDTATSYQYDALLRQRAEQEETMLELLQLQRNGGVAAPFSGSVYSVDYDEELMPLSLVTLTPDEKMIVTLSVDESDILSLKLGQEAQITISSLSDETFTGTVTEIQRITETSGVYTAVVTLEKTVDMLPGMTAKVSIRITGVENALLIPVEALHQTRSGAFVYTSYDAQTQTFGGETPVTVGMMGDNEVEILSGLEEGDVVWYKEELTIADFFGMAGMSGMAGSRPSGNAGSRPSGNAGSRPGGNTGNRPGGADAGYRG